MPSDRLAPKGVKQKTPSIRVDVFCKKFHLGFCIYKFYLSKILQNELQNLQGRNKYESNRNCKKN